MNTVKVAQYGLGPIGLGIVEVLLTRPWVQFVGAIDIDKSKVGRDVGELLDPPRKIGVTISDKAKDVLRRTTPDIVTHATSSYMELIHPQISEIVDHGASVVSSAEELSYPFVKYPELSKKIHGTHKKRKLWCLGRASTQGSCSTHSQ